MNYVCFGRIGAMELLFFDVRLDSLSDTVAIVAFLGSLNIQNVSFSDARDGFRQSSAA